MDQTTGQACTDQQIAEGTAAELESLSLECRIDPARLERLLAPDFHEFGTCGGQIGYEGTAARIAAATSPEDEPITAENMRGWLLADGLVMLKYTSQSQGRRVSRTSLWRGTATGRWQIFHHQARPRLADGNAHDLWVPNTYATRRYSWMTPAARSCRRT